MLLLLIPLQLCPSFSQAKSQDAILDSPKSLTAYIQSFGKFYLPFFLHT